MKSYVHWVTTVVGCVTAGLVVVTAEQQQQQQSRDGKTNIVKSIFSNAANIAEQHDDFHRLLSVVESHHQDDEKDVSSSGRHNNVVNRWRSSPTFPLSITTSLKRGIDHIPSRRLEDFDDYDIQDDDDVQQEACDSAFIQCLPNAKCVDCFATLETENIDWTGVTADVSCDDVVGFLGGGNHCRSLDTDTTAKDLFCAAFDACVVWDDDAGDGFDDDDSVDPDWVDCSALTECDWDGKHENWIGDGVCHDNVHGCYNTAICGYDGGDCCEDTCEINDTSSYTECGHDGYACKDPESTNCDPKLTRSCPSSSNGGSDNKDLVVCDETETKYRLVMYDSFGDGWDTTALTISPEGSDDVVFKGGLIDGFQGTEYICLSRRPQCYNVVTQGGQWGVEISWEIRPMSEGSPAIAGGAAPADCDFSVAGDVCDKTCDGSKPDIDPTTDPDYNSFKDLYTCIEDKCIIQLGACNEDESCRDCFKEDAPDYCFGVDTFVAVVDCTMCSCTEKKDSEYCSEKSGPGQVVPPVPGDGEDNGPKECTPKETMAGAAAIMDFGKCSDMDEVFILVSEFDQNNFGMLDQFESCAHSYRDEHNHGGRTALECMKILKTTITNPIVEGKEDAPVEAISALAKNLYDHAETFCDCSKKASDHCPLCPNFMNFKTLLYESLDACESLDAIDCASWNEFWKPCKKNLEAAFGSSDFDLKDQCDYVKEDCGDSKLAFPAFRRLDCEGEIPDQAWSFYKQFNKKCLKGSDGIPPSGPAPITPSDPVPAPSKAPDSKPSAANKPTPKPYIPDSGGGKPYVPSDDRDSSDSSSESGSKKKSHWFRNLLIILAIGGAGYYVYKKRSDGFNFVQYRRRVFGNRFGGGFNYGMVNSSGESEMYSNLNSSTTFEPPSLPPTPQALGGPSMMMQSVGQMGQQMMGTEMT